MEARVAIEHRQVRRAEALGLREHVDVARVHQRVDQGALVLEPSLDIQRAQEERLRSVLR
jgi:hypothetical protein